MKNKKGDILITGLIVLGILLVLLFAVGIGGGFGVAKVIASVPPAGWVLLLVLLFFWMMGRGKEK